jgi:hypothetical protein
MTKPLLIAALITLSVTPLLAHAQADVFQTVTVGDLSYSLDPYYPVACYWIKDVPGGRRWDGTKVVEEGGAATMQCFHRDQAGAMVAWPAFTTTNDGVLEHTDLGQPMYAMPQTAMEQQP